MAAEGKALERKPKPKSAHGKPVLFSVATVTALPNVTPWSSDRRILIAYDVLRWSSHMTYTEWSLPTTTCAPRAPSVQLAEASTIWTPPVGPHVAPWSVERVR